MNGMDYLMHSTQNASLTSHSITGYAHEMCLKVFLHEVVLQLCNISLSSIKEVSNELAGWGND